MSQWDGYHLMTTHGITSPFTKFSRPLLSVQNISINLLQKGNCKSTACLTQKSPPQQRWQKWPVCASLAQLNCIDGHDNVTVAKSYGTQR